MASYLSIGHMEEDTCVQLWFLDGRSVVLSDTYHGKYVLHSTWEAFDNATIASGRVSHTEKKISVVIDAVNPRRRAFAKRVIARFFEQKFPDYTIHRF